MSTTATALQNLTRLAAGRRRFGTIFADPPWREQGAGKIKRGADRHYPLMKTEEIVATGGVVQQLAKPTPISTCGSPTTSCPLALK